MRRGAFLSRPIASALLVLGLALPAAGASRQIGSFTEGAFAGSVYADERGLMNCGARVRYDSLAFALSIVQDRDRDWSLIFIKLDWRMRVGERMPVRLRVDGGAWRSFAAAAGSPTGLVVILPRDQALLAAISRGSWLELDTGREVLPASLSGVDRVMARLQRCVEQYLAEEKGRPPAGGEGQAAAKSAEATKREQPRPARSRQDAFRDGVEPSIPGFRRITPFTVGPWSGGGLVEEKSGAFAGCMAGARYPDLVVDVAIRHDGIWSLGLRKRAWSLSPGAVGVRLDIDEAGWRDLRGEVVDGTYLLTFLGEAAPFARARSLDVEIAGSRYGFNLAGMAELTAALQDCRAAGARIAAAPGGRPGARAPDRKPAEEKKPEISSGTGIVVSAAGHVVTNHHVAGECKALSVQRPGEPPAKAAFVTGDEKNDLALLKAEIRPGEGEVAPIGSRPMAAGSPIAVYGFPLAGALASTGNIVAGNISALAGLGNDINFFQISAPVQPGNSGGPLLDYRGAVVGVIQSKISDRAVIAATGTVPQTVNFAIKAIVLQNFLEVHSVDYRSDETPTTLDLPGVAAAARKFTVMVLCEG